MPHRRAARISMAVSSRRYLQIVERVVALGTWAWEPSTGAMVWSDALHRLMRTDPVTYVPTMDDVIALTHPDDRWIVQEKLRAASDFAATPVRMVLHDGSIRWQVCHMERLSGANSATTVVIGIVQDVSEAWNAHTLLLQRQRLFDGLVHLMGAFLWRAEKDGTPIIDKSWCDFTGTSLADNEGDRWLDQLHPEDRSETKAAWQRAVQTQSLFSTTYRARCYDGRFVPVDAKASPLLAVDGTVIEWLGYCAPTRGIPSALVSVPDPDELAPTSQELKAARNLTGLSTQSLAEISGVSVSTINRYEAGDAAARIRPGNLARLRTALGQLGLTYATEPDGTRILRYRIPGLAGDADRSARRGGSAAADGRVP